MTLRITPRARTIKARAHELRFIQTTAKLAREQGKKLVVPVTASARTSR
jgi:hypothetical protein